MTTENTQTQTADITSPIVTDGPQPVVNSPVVEVNPAPPVVDAPEVDAAPVQDDVAPKVTPKWAQERINELTAKRHEAERRAAAAEDARKTAEELLTHLQKPNTSTTSVEKPTAPQLTEQEIDRRVQEKAAQLAQVAEFNKTCNEIAATGEKEFKDWGDALKNLTMVGAVGEHANPEFLETAVELQSPHKVLHYLGTNLDQAKRIAEMSPKRMALELARLEAVLNAPAPIAPMPPVSNAPAPIIPVGGQAKPGNPDIADPNLSPDDWFALRAKQVEERKSRYRR